MRSLTAPGAGGAEAGEALVAGMGAVAVAVAAAAGGVGAEQRTWRFAWRGCGEAAEGVGRRPPAR